jgi:3alpha(or 20beta)-hydroxysteroid dehydrogenase
MGRLEGKVALISGSARGQGKVEAELFLKEGARVVITDIDAEQGAATAAELGKAATFAPLDVTQYDQWTAAVDHAVSRFGKLDVLVNNAGLNFTAYIEDTSVEDYLRVMRVNQLGTWLGMKAVVPAMRAAGGGSIVNTVSIASLSGIGGKTAYVSSKHAARGMSLSAAGELGRYGIRVNCVHPGGVATEMFHAQVKAGTLSANFSGQPIPRVGEPMEVALAVLYLASDEASYCTGTEIVVDGGLRAVLPVKANPAGGAP